MGHQESLRRFVDDSLTSLAGLRRNLARGPIDLADVNGLDSTYQILHAIKCCSSFLGLRNIERLSRAGEMALHGLQDGVLSDTTSVRDSLLETCDLLLDLIAATSEPDGGVREEPRFDALLARWNDINAPWHPAAPSPAPSPATPALAPDKSVWPAPGRDLSSDLIRQFIAEASENIHEVESALLRLEEHPDDADNINAVFRPIHSVKGTADYVGLAQIKTLSHHVESVLDLARSNRLDLTPAVTSAIFEGIDALKSMIHDLGPDGEADRDLSLLVTTLLRITREVQEVSPNGKTDSPSPSVTAALSESHAQLATFAQSAAQHVQSVCVQSDKFLAGDLSETTIATLRRSTRTLLNAADYMDRHEFVAPCDRLLEILDHLPGSFEALGGEERAPVRGSSSELQTLLTHLHDELRREASGPTEASSTGVAPSQAASPPASSATSAKSSDATPGGNTAAKAQPAKSLRVEQEKLDEYVNLAGELVIARNSLTHAFRELHGLPSSTLRRLKSAIDGVDRIATTIQDNAMSMRMIPVKTLFQRFPRVVRDIAKGQGKKIDLQIFGEETEIDKQVAETLGDPLVHLIRNSADHGIESPEVRSSHGKPETGVITLKAGREGNAFVIEILDDGAGIHVDRLKAKAVEHGVISPQQAESMSRDEAIQLIFAAGLSTAAKVTDVSGRGVGMDVVRTNIKNCGGSVYVTSTEGQGTQLRIELPLTLAVTTALLVASDDQTYALPIENVQETVKVAPDQVKRLKGQHAITLRGSLVPLKNLSAMLTRRIESQGRSHRLDTAQKLVIDETGSVSIVVVEVCGERFGLVVNAVLGRQEIVLKPLPEYLAVLPGLGSATVMGDGTIVLILDPAEMYEAALATAE